MRQVDGREPLAGFSVVGSAELRRNASSLLTNGSYPAIDFGQRPPGPSFKNSDKPRRVVSFSREKRAAGNAKLSHET
jgi:hypothetical protein